MRRREFVKLGLSTTGAAWLSSCARRGKAANSVADRRVLVVAFDGLDPKIVQSLMDQGRLPNFKRLADRGSFRRLATCIPPHTPVAFSSIISGTDPGKHQIFDFIHRDPMPSPGGLAIRPFFSTADTQSPEQHWLMPESISLGRWELPLSGADTMLLRRGPAFWDYLIEQGIDADIYYLPANYPAPTPVGPGRFRCMAGMGTPDLLGSYGEFTCLTPNTPMRGKRVGGGRFVYLSMISDHGEASLEGPKNFLLKEKEAMKLRVRIVRDPTRPVARIEISGKRLILKEGEWSNWIPIRFQTGIPGSTLLGAAGAPTSVQGIVTMYLKQVHPMLELYISPVNIDPHDPVSPISTPADFATELARQHGRFCTLGIPEDTKSLSRGALNEDQFLSQVELVHDDKVRQYRAALSGFQRGCLFFYFGATDLIQHMFWRDQDPQHPGRDTEQGDRYSHVIEETYVGTDKLVGDALAALDDDDVLIVLSDHGFNSFRRGFNLNSWLLKEGFITLDNPAMRGQHEMFVNVDWSKTKAYGLGMNAVYLNLAGREQHGVVEAKDRESLLKQIRDGLLKVRDVDGSVVIDTVDLVENLYPNTNTNCAPDLIVGYREGYRASWGTILGKMPPKLIEDNLDRWSGTHLINAARVPGILCTNIKVTHPQPSIKDIAPTILGAFGISTPRDMDGHSLLDDSEQLS